jgi:hypothetical protein
MLFFREEKWQESAEQNYKRLWTRSVNLFTKQLLRTASHGSMSLTGNYSITPSHYWMRLILGGAVRLMPGMIMTPEIRLNLAMGLQDYS